jgi:D-alanyl-D-alanine carboxypeptidase (penicillin-binding protein 5/6)
MEPASLVKLMTVYVAFAELAAGDLALEEMVTVSRKAWRMGGSQMFIEVGSRVSVEGLLKGIIVQSGNDASVALAEQVSGTEEAFVQLMNEHAVRLGMTGSSFANSHGLPHERNFTTARDVAILMRALMRDFPEKYRWHSLESFTHNNIKQPNRNRLLKRDPSVDGGKTGYTKAAGHCLAVSANREGMRVVAVVMGAPGSPERFRAAQALLSYGYRNFRTSLVYAEKESIGTVRVWSGDRPSVEAGVAEDLWLTVERRKAKQVDTRVAFDEPLIAPVPAAGRVGTLEVTLGDEKIAERELVALAEVPQGSLYRRALDWFWLLWR